MCRLPPLLEIAGRHTECTCSTMSPTTTTKNVPKSLGTSSTTVVRKQLKTGRMEPHCLAASCKAIRCELFRSINGYTHPPSCRSHPDTVDNNLRLVEDLQRTSIPSDASCFCLSNSDRSILARRGEAQARLGRDPRPYAQLYQGGSRTCRQAEQCAVPVSPQIRFVPSCTSSIHPRQAALGFQSASEGISKQARNLKVEFEKEAAESQAGPHR